MSGGGEGRRAERRRGGKLYELTVVKCPQTNPITEEEVKARKGRGGEKGRRGGRLILSHLRSTNVHSNVYDSGVPLYLKEPHRLLSWSVPEGAKRRVMPP